MSFCCGASMIGTKGSIRHLRTQIHNVPILFCPVCHRIEVHHLVEDEYEILAEYAQGDGAAEVDFEDYSDAPARDLFENCVNQEHEDPLALVTNQIDMALDLLRVAKALDDVEWEYQLKNRLRVMSGRRDKIRRKKTAGGGYR
ncbi:hypothetical protein MO973_02610 [Paenibacillus sp. TRM 82003]|nr:hypothetical protein [Paenibacillus sp. TRM 82003]